MDISYSQSVGQTKNNLSQHISPIYFQYILFYVKVLKSLDILLSYKWSGHLEWKCVYCHYEKEQIIDSVFYCERNTQITYLKVYESHLIVRINTIYYIFITGRGRFSERGVGFLADSILA